MEYIIDQIQVKNPLHSKKIHKNLEQFDDDYYRRAEEFFMKYKALLNSEGRSFDYAIESYLKMLADVNFESLHFLRTGEYTSKSFEEVNKRVYDNPQVMEYYMHGLLLSQFLWKQHYNVLLWFHKIIKQNCQNIKYYLEVGGGHGLYISEALKLIGESIKYDLVDISKTSLDMAKKMISNEMVTPTLTDIFDYSPQVKYDFITMGEVLEHVEDPVQLLKKVHTLLSDTGKLVITTPTNAPAIDHIYLFKDADDIREVVYESGFQIGEELCIFSEDVSPKIATELKVSMMYAGVLTKK